MMEENIDENSTPPASQIGRLVMRPLNGTQTHPLSSKAIEVLKNICKKPIPCSEINPGIQDRLFREGLVSYNQLISPYKKHKGGLCVHLVITHKGRELLSA